MISILLASYNGEKFIREQLDSLFAQSVQDFDIYICDDASNDSTVSIIKDYESKFPGRIVLLINKKNSRSPKHAFFRLMREVRSDYLMLCDQDDVWNKDKVELSLKKIKDLEEKYGKHTPLLAYSDLTVVDGTLKLISPSFKKMMNSDYTKNSLNTLLVQNVLTGCTAIYNRVLAELITDTPNYCVMHDWWLILVASAFGKIGVIEEPTLLHRQHGRNSVGAKNVKSMNYKIKRLIGYKEVKHALTETYMQAESFLDIYGSYLSSRDMAMLRDYISIPSKNKIARWRIICKYGIMKIGFTRRIAHFIFI